MRRQLFINVPCKTDASHKLISPTYHAGREKNDESVPPTRISSASFPQHRPVRPALSRSWPTRKRMRIRVLRIHKYITTTTWSRDPTQQDIAGFEGAICVRHAVCPLCGPRLTVFLYREDDTFFPCVVDVVLYADTRSNTNALINTEAVMKSRWLRDVGLWKS